MNDCRKDGHAWVTKSVNCGKERPLDKSVRIPASEYHALRLEVRLALQAGIALFEQDHALSRFDWAPEPTGPRSTAIGGVVSSAAGAHAAAVPKFSPVAF